MLLSNLQNASRNIHVKSRDTSHLKLKSLPDNYISKVVSDEDRKPSTRRPAIKKYIHVSELIRGVCIRKIILQNRLGIYDEEDVTGGHRVVWALGRAVESHVRNSFIAQTKGLGVLGKWSCKCGHVKFTGFQTKNVQFCPKCNTACLNYNELRFVDETVGVVGHPDFILKLDGNKLVIVEIKSIKAKTTSGGVGFDDLDQPIADHTMQAAIYRFLAKNMGYDVHDEVIVFYCTKDFKWGSPYKEYRVDVTKGHWQESIDRMWNVALEMRNAINLSKLPSRKVCSSVQSTDAKSCSVVTSCFAL